MITSKELDALPENKRAQFEELMAVLPVDDYPVRAAKTLLVNGFKPDFVAEYTGVKLEKVIDLYENSWNPRCRKPTSDRSNFTNVRIQSCRSFVSSR